MAARASTSDELALEFARLFDGLGRAHGRYVVPAGARPNGKGKVEGKPWTAKRAIQHRDWVDHLTGNPVTLPNGDGTVTGTLGLGVVPIRDDATCVFGAIDVDVYPLDLKALVGSVKELGLPLVVCRTKSGGAHLYVFMTEAASAELVRTRLMEFAVLLGHPGVEVFPKQTRLAGEQDDGSWINLPYAGGDRSTRYALGPGGDALTTADFLTYARERAVSPDDLATLSPNLPSADVSDELLRGGPPCLQVIARRGLAEDFRNNLLFNIGVYLRKRHDDDFERYIDDYNRRFMATPLSSAEVQATVKSLRKKAYSYKCKDQPINQVCNRQVCLGCEFGVGGAKDDPGVVLGELVKLETQPPTWLWDVNGARLELTTQELMDQRLFQTKVIEVLNVWPNLVSPGAWQSMIRERLQRCEVLAVPQDATREGQLWVHLEKFCTSRVVGRSIDELLMGKPYTDEANGRTYFCASDFMQYLQQHRVSQLTERELYKWLRHHGVDHHFNVIKGKGLNFWSIPAVRGQTEEHDVPRRPPAEAM